MRSVVPSESETVPLPAHDPSKPANGPDWAWLACTDNRSAAPTPAALIACPNRPNSFISDFPIQMDVLMQDTSRHIEALVSPRCLRFNDKPAAACNCANGPAPPDRRKIHKLIDASEWHFRKSRTQGPDICRFRLCCS